MEDWFGTEYSCCLCLPIKNGVHIIGVTQIINALLVLRQVNNVTDDGSSQGEHAGPKFFYISYLCWSPWLFAIFTYLNFLRKDTFDIRNEMVKGSTAVFFSLIALYGWFFAYFISIEQTDFQTKNTIFLVILLFSVPQILIHQYFAGVLARWAK